MSNTFNFPDFKTILYRINNETGRYEKQPDRVPFEKLPFELKVETTREQMIINNGATEIITGRIKGGKRLFFTGLIPAPKFNDWFLGNDYQKLKDGTKKNSLVIFNFRNDNRELIIYYFNSYYIHNRDERIKFVCTFIQSQENI